ncbi:site-specific DNA-methyltransferase [Prevotella sp.]|uniref:site-specific DNA-methyltransferase n=1 Tax=Prevotella sp. TaxID=59823 RepID=UPI002647C97E|nr:site-specific DNA-methyltransferase [Prevotella sp.]MDN5553241.1 site-specific DNA-methyltransferase [Prevotella sp.]
MIKNIIDENSLLHSNSKQLSALHHYFEGCFTADGKFDIESFKEKIREDVAITEEGYGLNFLGKDYSNLIASIDTTTVVEPDIEHNNLPENKDSENIYISGDNLDALKHLLRSYESKVKCIYIDPPYNTGSDGFVYNDNFNFSSEQLQKRLGIDENEADRLMSMTSKGSSSHSAWLMFMSPRLQLARDLLSKDGVIFISIDDNEQADLKLLCDYVFGEENFLAQITVQANKRGQTYKALAKTHEYMLVYVHSESSIIYELKKELGANTFKDDVGDFSERELRNRNPKYGRFNRPNLYYPVYVNPSEIDNNGYSPVSLTKDINFSVEVLPLNSLNEESCWRWGTKKFTKNSNVNTMISDVVSRKKQTGEYGIYEKYRKGTYKAKTIWYEDLVLVDDDDDQIWDETGVITEQGSIELRKYGMGDIFDFPKPSYLIKKVLSIGSSPDAICLDFFSGSGTLADSVMSLNAISGNRKYIAVQLDERLDEKLENSPKSERPKIQKVIDFLDENNHPHTLDYIGYERIRRSANRIHDENPLFTGDLGFKHYTLREVPENVLEKLEDFNPEETNFANNIMEMFGRDTVLTTWIERDGCGLNAKYDEVKLEDYTAYQCGDYLYLLDEGMSNEAITALIDKYGDDTDWGPHYLVVFGYSFNFGELDSIKKNVTVLQVGEKQIKVNIEVRY